MRTILLCVDRDEVVEDLLVAFRWGVRLESDDRVLVCHVMPEVPWLRAVGRVDPTVAEQVETLPTRAASALSEAVDYLSKEGIHAESLLRKGDTATEIEKVAQEERVDLIVLGALGSLDVENLLVGSVSQKVKRHSDRDLFIVRGHGPTGRSRYKAVLGVDESEESFRAVRSFLSNMDVVLADVYLLHVVESDEPGSPQATLDRASELMRSEGLSFTTEVRHGRPAAEIVRYAREQNADVIVLGIRGLGAIEGIVKRSVSQGVLRHAPCAVYCAVSRE